MIDSDSQLAAKEAECQALREKVNELESKVEELQKRITKYALDEMARLGQEWDLP